MKKENVLTFRVDDNTKRIIESLAKQEDRSIGYTLRKLVTDALKQHGLLKK
jgi:predicted transcriptional regulator